MSAPTVAALYVDPSGVYANQPGVEVWGEDRDARLYDGPWPVVAHPPCNKWSPLAYINAKRIPGYVVGDDGGCFASALAAVRQFGGVLEHPAESLAWRHFRIPRPRRDGWWSVVGMNARITEVDQGRYGHRARKRTWLFTVGCELPALDWRVADADAIVSGFTHQPRGAHVACEHRRVRPREASATPPAFRDVLLSMARSASFSPRPFDLCPSPGRNARVSGDVRPQAGMNGSSQKAPPIAGPSASMLRARALAGLAQLERPCTGDGVSIEDGTTAVKAGARQ